MEWLVPNNAVMDWVDFATQVVFELKFNDECLSLNPSEDCFKVSIRWNGHDLAFDRC